MISWISPNVFIFNEISTASYFTNTFFQKYSFIYEHAKVTTALCRVLGRVHTLTEKRKPIGTRSSNRRYISLVCFCLSASSDWLPLFRFPFFHQGVNPALGYFHLMLQCSFSEQNRSRDQNWWISSVNFDLFDTEKERRSVKWKSSLKLRFHADARFERRASTWKYSLKFVTLARHDIPRIPPYAYKKIARAMRLNIHICTYIYACMYVYTISRF